MVERRGRDISGKWIYRCHPCAAVCSGEAILQTHISGKKHKSKLSMRTVWSNKIFDEQPVNQNSTKSNETSDNVVQKMAQEIDLYNKKPQDLDEKYAKYRNVKCHIQETIDNIKVPLLGVEYLIEHPPDQPHHEPSYICTLCDKQGYPRTISNHLTCYWHRSNYLARHFPKASMLLGPYRAQARFREGVRVLSNRLAQRIEDKYGRMKPLHLEKELYEKEKDCIRQWISRSFHYSEQQGPTFEEVVDTGLIESLEVSFDKSKSLAKASSKKDPSPPVVAAPSKPHFNTFNKGAGRQKRRGLSPDSLSDISDDVDLRRVDDPKPSAPSAPSASSRGKYEQEPRYEPYPERHSESLHYRSKYNSLKNSTDQSKTKDKTRPANYEHKVKLAREKHMSIQESMKKTLAYHEKNPEKHPLYPEEWKKFWNRRYKEIQSEGKDPSKHDFKPEWIAFWTARMKELHNDEVRVQVLEVYRKLCLSPPDMMRLDEKPTTLERRKSLELKVRSSERKHRSPEWKVRSPERKLRSPDRKLRSVERKLRSPERKTRASKQRLKSPEPRRRSPLDKGRVAESRRPNTRKRSSERRQSPPRRDARLDLGRRSPIWRSVGSHRSPSRPKRARSRSPIARMRSPTRTNLPAETLRHSRSRSPLSQREASPRNRSPQPQPPLHRRHRHHHRHHSLAEQDAITPSQQTVLISDEEFKPDDGLSPWNSDNDIDSVSSLPEVRSGGSMASRGSRARYDRDRDMSVAPHELGPPENVVATLRLLVALEDYLGSLGPKVVDLLTQAIKMEKEVANSSEELLEQEPALVLIETAKEKLKGAVQAGLVAHNAAGAVRAAVVRAAATLHEADNRARRKPPPPPPPPHPPTHKQSSTIKSAERVPVAGIGQVDRAQIAKQMAEALIAQGKTDVSAEELSQLVEAVVGMAEAKKREADTKKLDKNEPKKTKTENQKISGTASALQMLQSAYDENEKKFEKEDATDAMDGLSDSDLETLLKNFNELSAEEQHSLIAFLKKLEVREPSRVERLRQYVSTAAAIKPEEETNKQDVNKLVTIESDDDDYTVEEVFKSATLKVKEDQIRQEMEIVKKSLEESKMEAPPAVENKVTSGLDLAQAFSSASDLLAFLQTNMQSTSAIKTTTTPAADVVATNTQPISFGDTPDSVKTFTEAPKPISGPTDLINPKFQQGNQQDGLLKTPNLMNPNQMNYGGNSMQNDYKESNWNQASKNSTNMGRRGRVDDNQIDNLNWEVNNRMTDNWRPIDDNRMSDNMGYMDDNFISDNRGPMVDNQMSNNMGYRGDNQMADNRGFIRSNQVSNMGYNRNSDKGDPMANNQMSNSMGYNRMYDNRGSMEDNQMSSNRGYMGDNCMTDNRSSMGDNQLSNNLGYNRMSNNMGPVGDNQMFNNRGYMGDNSMPDNRGSMGDNLTSNNMGYNRGHIGDNRGHTRPLLESPRYDNYNQNQLNQGPRGNFVNSGNNYDNFDPNRADVNNMNNQYDNNYGNQNNFRGRGGRGQRGRGSQRGGVQRSMRNMS